MPSPALVHRTWPERPSRRPALGPLEQCFAERGVSFDREEIQHRQYPHLLAYRGRRGGYGARHAFDQGAVAPAIEVAEERVAQVVLPADGIDRVYGRLVPGPIAVAAPAVAAATRQVRP